MTDTKTLQGLRDAMMIFDSVLPDIKEHLGADNPLVIDAEEAAQEIKDRLAELGYPAQTH